MGVLDKMLRIAGRGPDGLAKAIQTDAEGNLKTTITGSLAKLNTDPFPIGKEGWEMLEYNVVDGTSKVYVYISDAWREI